MSVRSIRLAGYLLVALGSVSPAVAGVCEGVADFFHSIPTDVKRRQCWPQPFVGPDRAAVRAPFATMVSNGWRRQNMLGDYYFDSGNASLNEAGVRKIRWILTEAPQQHRIVYVRVADSEEATAKRITLVQEQVAKIAPQGTVIPVLPTTIRDEGSSADEVEAITRGYLKNMPSPRLPAPKDDQGSGSSSSSGT
jgi:hypothetical protein